MIALSLNELHENDSKDQCPTDSLQSLCMQWH